MYRFSFEWNPSRWRCFTRRTPDLRHEGIGRFEVSQCGPFVWWRFVA